MTSHLLTSQHPSNTGQKWTNEEETLLLEELSKNINVLEIAQSHQRTTGAILSRRKEIAFKMHCNHQPMEEIIMKTKLNKHQIAEAIIKRQNNPKPWKSVTEKPQPLFPELDEIKHDIKELKNTMKELVEMMKAVYEFEDG